MNPWLQVALDHPAAAASGAAGAICLAVWPQFRSRGAMLGAQLGASLGFGAYFALLSMGVGAFISFLAGLQTVLALPLDRAPRWRVAYLCTVPGMSGAVLLAWQGPESLLALAALGLINAAQLQTDPRRLRLLGLAGAACWGGFGFAMGSLAQFAGNLTAIGASLFRIAPQARSAHHDGAAGAA